ncbi:MAG: hypothetical protein HYS05_04540 [Acidobacteria bacterium]|nr:hypothetical protein [Acidobacteriota bacterium]
MTRTSTRVWWVALAAVMLPVPASAQLDPLLFLKRSQPNVLLVVETANRMQRDASDDYYDMQTYTIGAQPWEAVLGLTSSKAALKYRRKYVKLTHLDTSLTSDRFEADGIVTVGDLEAGFATFEARTRLSTARAALQAAVQANQNVARFGLLKTRQLNARPGSLLNEGPVRTTNSAFNNPTETGLTNKWLITRPEVDAVNGSLTAATAPLVRPDAAGANSAVQSVLAKPPDQVGALVPGGRDSKIALDVPIEYMLDDARAEASRLIAADTLCRNTVVVLVVGGGEGTTAASQNPAAKASQFLNVGGRRVPIYVVAIAPAATAVAQLQAIAANSGGQYFEITKGTIDAAPSGTAVPEAVRAINRAIQHAYADVTTFNTAPSAQYPLGPLAEFQVTSPVSGTVNLANARDINGSLLPDTAITHLGTLVPQRSNVMVTSGFTLPGFDGRLRAFRTYRPEPDSSKPSGYRFVGDGTRLWIAQAPTGAQRNIFTMLADGSVVSFAASNASALSPYLGATDPQGLITYIRDLPIGAIVSSTPAFLDPPSLDPPPDASYPGFANTNKDRRSLMFIGANDGMLHAIDGRTGTEVWAVIPFNLLPKLKALQDGQAIGEFDFFVDASAKIADVKVGGQWRTYLFIGEGAGGTFYQAFDVTLAGISASIQPDDDNITTLLDYFKDPSRVPFKWSFPRYTSFDPGVAPYGDLSASASSAEKSVGQTWSDPSVGQVVGDSGPYAMLAGSGFFPYSGQQQPNRGGRVAGTTFYMLDVATGTVLDSRDVGSDGRAEDVDSCASAGNCEQIKNALQSDPVATGPSDTRFMTTAYIGDLDGRLWRFSLGLTGSQAAFVGSPIKLLDVGAAQPIFSSMATVNVGGTQQYLFFGAGSDLLPTVGVSEAYRLFGVLDQSGSGFKRFDIPLATVDNAGDDEKVTAFPAVAGDIVFFSTTVFKPAAPCTVADANLYALTFIGGPAYDNTGDQKIDRTDTPKAKTILAGGRATAPFVVDQHLLFGAGSKVELLGDPQDFNNGVGQAGVRILSWRDNR